MDILFPVGRMIGGSVHKPQPKLDNNGDPQLDHQGQPKVSFSFGVAFPKAGEAHWGHTEWGQKILQEAATAYPNMYRSPSFSWKIQDGDSTIPNRKGNAPVNQEGYPGNWVVWFNQSWAPKLCDAKGFQLDNAEKISAGNYIQPYASVKGNGVESKPAQTPGVYINPLAVAFIGFGEPIMSFDVDTTAVGFGQAPMPAGVSATPIGMSAPAAGMIPAASPSPFPPQQAPMAQQASLPAPPPTNPAILGVPGVPGVPGAAVPLPPAPPVPQAAPIHQMTAKAAGITHEQMIAQGWTDVLLVQHGYMIG